MDSMEMLQKTGLNKALRDVQIIARARSGESLNKIAADYGITGEAVRRLLIRRGEGSVRTMRKENQARTLAQRDQLRELVEGWVKLHPGCSFEEIADEFREDVETVREAAHGVQYLVLKGGRRPNVAPSGTHAQWHHADACAAIATAAEVSSPLTREKYDELRLEGRFQGPSGAWITTRFPSWRDACEQAGVQCGEPRRAEYTKKWTNDDMLDWIGRYFMATLNGSASGYGEWASATHGAPSGSTVRNALGSWPKMREQALLRLRDTWSL